MKQEKNQFQPENHQAQKSLSPPLQAMGYEFPSIPAEFETRLADIMVTHQPEKLLQKVNLRLFQILSEKKITLSIVVNLEKFRNELLAYYEWDDRWCLTVMGCLEILIQLLGSCNNPYDLSNLHKIVFERVFLTYVLRQQDRQEGLPSLSYLARQAVTKNAIDNIQILRQGSSVNTIQETAGLYHFVRPRELFAKENRGRLRDLNGKIIYRDGEHSQRFGIMLQEQTPPEYLMKLPFAITHASTEIVPDPESSFVQECTRRNVPYCAGPSGSIGFILSGILLLDDFSQRELEEIVAFYAATLVAMGHHSFYESIVIARQVGLFAHYDQDETGEITVRFNDNDDDPVYSFIPHNIRQAQEFQDLLKDDRFSEFAYQM